MDIEDVWAFLNEQDDVFTDLETGAWFQAMQDSIAIFNEQNGTNFDPYDTLIDWCRLKQ